MPRKKAESGQRELQLNLIARKLKETVETARDARIAQIEEDEREFYAKHFLPSVPPIEHEKKLLPRQVAGVKWLSASFDLGCSSILGDEMGMGKTVQTIATLMRLRANGVRGPFLLVVPTAVLLNWKAEFEMWADRFGLPRFHVLISHSSGVAPANMTDDLAEWQSRLLQMRKKGYAAEDSTPGTKSARAGRLALMREFVRLVCAPPHRVYDDEKELEWVYDSAVLITSYGTLSNDSHELSALPGMFPGGMRQLWRMVILDEAHLVRNDQKKTNHAVVNLEPDTYLLLTGTIIHNNLKHELQTLLRLVLPACLASIKFMDGIEQLENSQLWTEDDQPVQALCDVREILYSFTLRRLMRDNALEYKMPLCKDVVVSLFLTFVQKKFYEVLKEKLPKAAGMYLTRICYEQQVDRHPLIVSASAVSEIKTEARFSAFPEPAAPSASKRPRPLKQSAAAASIKGSAEYLKQGDRFLRACAEASQKIAFLLAVFMEMDMSRDEEDHRVLVWSQSKKTIALIGMVLRIAGYRFSTITGDTDNMVERQDRVKRFNRPLRARGGVELPAEGEMYTFEQIIGYRARQGGDGEPSIMLLSTMAMNTGVNIPSADTVIFYDSHLNPQNDAQALARAYRKGQERNVLVLRLMTENTREFQFISELVQHKRRMQHWLEHRGSMLARRDETQLKLERRVDLARLLHARADWAGCSANEVCEWNCTPDTIDEWPEEALPECAFEPE